MGQSSSRSSNESSAKIRDAMKDSELAQAFSWLEADNSVDNLTELFEKAVVTFSAELIKTLSDLAYELVFTTAEFVNKEGVEEAVKLGVLTKKDGGYCFSQQNMLFYFAAKKLVTQSFCLGKADFARFFDAHEEIMRYLHFVVGVAVKENVVALLDYIFDEMVLKNELDDLCKVMVLGEGREYFLKKDTRSFNDQLLHYVKRQSVHYVDLVRIVKYPRVREIWKQYFQKDQVSRGMLQKPKKIDISRFAMNEHPAPTCAVPVWLGDHEVNVYLRCLVQSMQGYAKDCDFRFKEKINGRYVALTPAVDRAGCSSFPIALDYFLDKEKQIENSGVLILKILQANFAGISEPLQAYKAKQDDLNDPDSQKLSEEWMLLSSVMSACLEDITGDNATLNWAMEALIEAGSPEGLGKRIEEVDGAKHQRHDVFDEFADVLNSDGRVEIEIIMPHWINRNHWTSLQITLDKRVDEGRHTYVVDIIQHDPKLFSNNKSDDFNMLSDFKIISEAIEKRIKAIDKKLKADDLYPVKCQISTHTFDAPRQTTGDGNSCAVIMCDDIEKIIRQEDFSNTQTYPDYALALREKQIQFMQKFAQDDQDVQQYIANNQVRIEYFKAYDAWLQNFAQPLIADSFPSKTNSAQFAVTTLSDDDKFNPDFQRDLDRRYVDGGVDFF